MPKSTRFTLICLTVACLALLSWKFLPWRQSESDVLVGVSVTLTGNNAELGIQVRNGVGVALEDFNAKGGIDGRQIKTLVKDDEGSAEGAAKSDAFLIDNGVAAIIGHSTSSQTLAGLKTTEPHEMVMVSPTASTTALAHKDDFFFRVVDVSATRAEVLGKYIFTDRKCSSLAFVQETSNPAFSQSYVDAVAKGFESAGGKVLESLPFASDSEPDFVAIAERIKAAAPDAVCVVAGDIQTALMCQRLRLAGVQAPLFGSSMAFTPQLITHGGTAVDGITTVQSIWVSDDNPTYLPYMTRYRERYGSPAAFGAVFGYEAAMIVFEALKRTGGVGGEPLKKALLGLGKVKILTDPISLDSYGDVSRPFSLLTVKGGKFEAGSL